MFQLISVAREKFICAGYESGDDFVVEDFGHVFETRFGDVMFDLVAVIPVLPRKMMDVS